jgi:hypothetical protein
MNNNTLGKIVNPSNWGNHGWNFLIPVCYSYPDVPSIDDKHNFRVFFESLKYTLPCMSCRNNYQGHLNNLSLIKALESKQTLVKWIFKLKKSVGHSKKEYTEKDYINFIINKYNKPTNNLTNDFKIGLIPLILICLILLYHFKLKKYLGSP